MADTTNPLAPGAQTTEGKLTIAAFVVGTVLEGGSAVLSKLAEGHLVDPSARWYTIALAVVGVVLQVLTLAGYNKGRAQVKAAALVSGAAAAPPQAPAAQASSSLPPRP
jgi:hypothetical protein